MMTDEQELRKGTPWMELAADLPILPWQWERLMRFRRRGLPLFCGRLLLLIMPLVSAVEADCNLQGLEYFAGVGMVCAAMQALGYRAQDHGKLPWQTGIFDGTFCAVDDARRLRRCVTCSDL